MDEVATMFGSECIEHMRRIGEIDYSFSKYDTDTPGITWPIGTDYIEVAWLVLVTLPSFGRLVVTANANWFTDREKVSLADPDAKQQLYDLIVRVMGQEKQL